ncbi:IS66 family transposase [Sorangium sp. So ce1128]
MDATGTAIRAKEKHRYGHVFVLVAPGDGVLFRYTPTYDGPTVAKLFGGYQGTLVADASANHNVLFGPGKAREAGCWSHARRRFFKAFKAGAGKEAAFALQTIQALFRIEEESALLSPGERLALRQRESAPLIERLFAWVETQRLVVPEHAPLREGLVYLHNQREALCEFLSNGEIPIHNNASERALRRAVKGRRNWLFHGSDEHAVRACAITSLIATCQVHGLDPELYLQEILTVAPSYPLSHILDLSPKHWVATRQRLIAEGRLKYLDLARITGSRLVLRDR